jgi:hypothetical protein
MDSITFLTCTRAIGFVGIPTQGTVGSCLGAQKRIGPGHTAAPAR